MRELMDPLEFHQLMDREKAEQAKQDELRHELEYQHSQAAWIDTGAVRFRAASLTRHRGLKRLKRQKAQR